MINNFLLALLLIILIETIILFIVSIFCGLDEKEFYNQNLIFAWIVSSSLTLPYLYFVLPYFFSWLYYISFWEISVTFIEAIFYMFFFRINFLKWLYISFLANLASFSIWIIIFN